MQENMLPQNSPAVEISNTPVSNSNETPKQNNFLVVLLSVLLFVAVVIAGFFAYQTQILVKELTNLNVDRVTNDADTDNNLTNYPVATDSSVVKSVDDTKSFSNDKFSFKYNKDWDVFNPKIDGGGIQIYVGPQDAIRDIKKLFDTGSGFGGGSFLILAMSEVSEIPVYKSDEYQVVTKTSMKIDGLDVDRYSIKVIQDMQGFSKGDVLETVILPIDKTYLVIGLLDYQYKNEFEQILSTLKVTK